MPAPSRSLLWPLIVGALLAATASFTLAQQAAPSSPWWLELSRYLPYPVYLAPPTLALLLTLAMRLGPAWRIAALAGVLLVVFVTMDFHWHAAGERPAAGGRSARVMTYNIKAYKAALRSDGLASLAREIALADPDILLMQDTQTDVSTSAFSADAPVFGLPEVFVAGPYVIASRLPLKNCGVGRTDPGGLGYVHCGVDIGGRLATLVNVHFESPRRGLVAARREGIDGADDWQRNYAERLVQSRGLANQLETAGRPLVVAGDLNAPEASPVVGTLLGVGLRDAFAAGGRGWGYTYGDALRLGTAPPGLVLGGFAFLRIDHLLVSSQIEVLNCTVGNAGPSEHRAVIADLRFAN